MEQYLIRFFAGGLMVSAFAAVGDVVRPKSFAGLFGAVAVGFWTYWAQAGH
jgi:hypothetical protein